MLLELARFYRAEVAARGDQSHFSVWLSPGGLPAEWVKHLGRSFRTLLKRTRDLRVRLQLATIATGFGDVIDSCAKVLDKVPESAGPLILRRGHGGAYLPLMWKLSLLPRISFFFFSTDGCWSLVESHWLVDSRRSWSIQDFSFCKVWGSWSFV